MVLWSIHTNIKRELVLFRYKIGDLGHVLLYWGQSREFFLGEGQLEKHLVHEKEYMSCPGTRLAILVMSWLGTRRRLVARRAIADIWRQSFLSKIDKINPAL